MLCVVCCVARLRTLLSLLISRLVLYFYVLSLLSPLSCVLCPAECVTKCFHPNVHWATGEICLDILKKEWSPAWSIQSACRAIVALLQAPAPDSPLNCDAGNMLRAEDHRAFRSVVRMYCEEHAVKILTPSSSSSTDLA